MKIIKLPNSHRREHILTCWLKFAEAATYLNIGRETFRRLQEHHPCPARGGAGDRNRRFHTTDLDQWWEEVHQLDIQ